MFLDCMYVCFWHALESKRLVVLLCVNINDFILAVRLTLGATKKNIVFGAISNINKYVFKIFRVWY